LCHPCSFVPLCVAAITPILKQDSYIAQHISYYLREVRVVAYSQFLESYRSVTLASMARAFGVTDAFLDRYIIVQSHSSMLLLLIISCLVERNSELARFIAAGRINCKIDKVGGIVETNR
jgi:26S proteasome regulatory subunit N7